MSPLTLRRYRAQRMLERGFEAQRATVLARVRSRLRSAGASLDAADLEACYAQAWHGLYLETLAGAEVANPTAWLVLVTFRRAVDEHRARLRVAAGRAQREGAACPGGVRAHAHERDLAAELDDRARLRQLFEALRARLSPREREAAALCYLQGLSRAQAAARMGISERRMRKLMDGGGARPGVAAKVAQLLDTIAAGAWCEEQGSLMRALAYGVLDPGGERYRLAVSHRSECPACRAYVLSLRGLAAALPPAPALAHLLGAGALAGGGTLAGAAARVPGAGAGGFARGAPAAGTLSAGAGAGGGWVAAGPLGAKLAVGCLLAAGVGAGCLSFAVRPPRTPPALHGRPTHARAHAAGGAAQPYVAASASLSAGARTAAGPPATSAARAPSAREAAQREFGPEQLQASTPAATALPARSRARPRASAAALAPQSRARARASAAGEPAAREAPGESRAEREFSPG